MEGGDADVSPSLEEERKCGRAQDDAVGELMDYIVMASSEDNAEDHRGAWLKHGLYRDHDFTRSSKRSRIGEFERSIYAYPRYRMAFTKRSKGEVPLRSVTYLDEPRMLAAINEDDRGYLRWFMQRVGSPGRDDMVMIAVDGVSALDLQGMLLYMHAVHGCLQMGNTDGDGKERHAVFTPRDPSENRGYAVINRYALRSVRMCSLRYFNLSRLFVMTPLLVQMWSQVPVPPEELMMWGYGIAAVLMHMTRLLLDSSREVRDFTYSISGPGFGLYLKLPELISMYHDDDATLEAWIKQAVVADNSWDPNTVAKRNLTFYDVLRNFILQEKVHIIRRRLAGYLRNLFYDSRMFTELRNLYPVAWKILDDLHDRASEMTGIEWVPLVCVNVMKLPLRYWDERPTVRWAHFYLYELCFATDDLVPRWMRIQLTRDLRLWEYPRPAGAGQRNPTVDPFLVHQRDLPHYDDRFARPLGVEESEFAINVQPGNINPRTAWTIDSLGHALQCMEYAALDYAHERVRNRDRKCISNSSGIPSKKTTIRRNPSMVNGGYDVSGPLSVGDYALYSAKHVDLPVAMMSGNPGPLYMEKTLFVPEGAVGTEDGLVTTEMLRAMKLVRNRSYYYRD